MWARERSEREFQSGGKNIASGESSIEKRKQNKISETYLSHYNYQFGSRTKEYDERSR